MDNDIHPSIPRNNTLDDCALQSAMPPQTVKDKLKTSLMLQHVLLSWLEEILPEDIALPPGFSDDPGVSVKDDLLIGRAFIAFEESVNAFSSFCDAYSSTPVDKWVLLNMDLVDFGDWLDSISSGGLSKEMDSDGKQLPQGMLGLWFHSFDEDGKIDWQGYVVGRPDPHFYLVETFSWLTGSASSVELVRAEDMLGWRFYRTNQEMKDWHDRCGH